MATYVIGDVHGCYRTFLQLLKAIDFKLGCDQLRFVGDLFNRGPRNLAFCQWLLDHPDSFKTVLGNHDFFLLSAYLSHATIGSKDTIDDILYSPDADHICDWLRQQPLCLAEQNHLIVHAGLLPSWDIATALQLGSEVCAQLQSDNWQDFFKTLYGNTPYQWDDNLSGSNRYRVIVNALTRLRLCSPDGVMQLKFKQPPVDAPPSHLPWYAVPHRLSREVPIIFGHWSALGVSQQHNTICLDSGCVWGSPLTALRLEDQRFFQAQYAD